MSTKTLSGFYLTAYNITSPVTTLSITSTGYLGAGVTSTGLGAYAIVSNGGILGDTFAISLAGSGSINNNGAIDATSRLPGGAGITIGAGGVVVNHVGALIEGYAGILISGLAGTVINAGAIGATGTAAIGIYLQAGGMITNGVGGATKARIVGWEAIRAGSSTTLQNYGTVASYSALGDAVVFVDGGRIVNGSTANEGALITAPRSGVQAQTAAGTVINFGSIIAGYGVRLDDGGQVINGSAGDAQALIAGATVGVYAQGQAATVTNFGTIQVRAATSIGVSLAAGGAVINGGSTVTAALIEGPIGVLVDGAVGTVTNYGTIGDAGGSHGVSLVAGGTVTNGGAADTTALIRGSLAVAIGGAGVVHNFGAIVGNSFGTPPDGSAVLLEGGGSIVNGSLADTSALMDGSMGAFVQSGAGTITNFGVISGNLTGAVLAGGGGIVNGGATDVTALIKGRLGASAVGPNATIVNFGTIRGAALAGEGVNLAAGGVVTNGTTADTTALISACYGVVLTNGGTLNNFGVILGNSASDSVGVECVGAVSVTNGSAADAKALISGYLGVSAGPGGTVTNFGTIRGTGGLSIMLADATSRLNGQAGSTFAGVIDAGAGVVDAVGGVTTASGIYSTGKIVGAGALSLAGGLSKLGPGAELAVAQINVSGAATLVDVQTASLSDPRVWRQSGGTLEVEPTDKMIFSGTGNTFAGALAGAGAVVFSGGSDAFTGLTLSIAQATIYNATVTLAGTVANATNLAVTTPHLIIGAGGASLTGAGVVTLSNRTTNIVTGASAGATLTNVDNRIQGAGELGNGLMTLVNGAKGIILGNDSNALIINTGAAVVANAGIIDATGAGGVTILGNVANTGRLIAAGGDLTVKGNVSGTGTIWINGATVDITGTTTENVVFAGATGVLELGHSGAYAGQITGLSLAGTSSLDLGDIAYAAGTTKVSYLDNGSKTGGVLSVTDGTHTAHISLKGDYSASTFTTSSDGHGGTTVVDPVGAALVSRPTVARLVAQMAALETPAAALHATPHGATALIHQLAVPRIPV